MRKTLLYGGPVLTQVNGLVANAIAIDRNRIVAVGWDLQHAPAYKSFAKFNLRGKCLIPGLVDAHAHLYYWALTLGRVDLHGCASMDQCLKRIAAFAATLPKSEWVVGTGYQPNDFKKQIEPDRYMLDRVTGGRPAFIFSKDEHTAWVNTRTLERAGITRRTPDPAGGRIERLPNGDPSGLLREGPAFASVYRMIPVKTFTQTSRLWRRALDLAWKKGVTGVHSFDGPDAFSFFERLTEQNKLGLRINVYPRVEHIHELEQARVQYGQGTDFLRLAGIKIFADGSLGSRTALCFDPYKGTKGNYGIETTTKKEMTAQVKRAARLGFPCAIHAIGDLAVSNVLDVLQAAPKLPSKRRHRIEHVQLIRRRDIARFKRLGVVASMQPSHCAADVAMVRKYWGARGRDAYLFSSLHSAGVPLTFGSDCPIEPLDPLAGIAAAARRVPRNSRDHFYPKESLIANHSLFAFTAGVAFASGEEDSRGYLLPGYPADFVILPADPASVPPGRLYDMKVLATVIDGVTVYADSSIRL
ncbi:MAG: amidohydrolase [candidate division Zixibacteria bacterium]|nr:amidohydrolase [candidate division Zixibacteria bacterium]